MMNNVNLIGRLTREPELRFIAGSGKGVCNFTLAVDRNLSKDKKAEMQAKGLPTADFIRVVVWGAGGEFIASNAHKGTLVSVEGSIQTGSYKNDKGDTVYTTDVNGRATILEWGEKKEESYEDRFEDAMNDTTIPF